MGWEGCFDQVAQALILAGVDNRLKRAVLAPLVMEFRHAGWDPRGSIRKYRSEPGIRAVLYGYNGVDLRLDNAWYGYIRYDDRADLWESVCGHCHKTATDAASNEGHDRLLRDWAGHCQEHHGGDGTVDTDLLALPEESNGCAIGVDADEVAGVAAESQFPYGDGLDYTSYGYIKYDDGAWELVCGHCHRSATALSTNNEGHDRLNRDWAGHCQEHHGGTVDTDLLALPEESNRQRHPSDDLN